MVESWKHLGIISILIIWAGLVLLVHAWPGNTSMSFSQHAAKSKQAHLFYIVLFMLAPPLFYLFIVRWFVPSLKLPSVFTYLIVAGIMCQLVAVWVPDAGGFRTKIHNAGAYGMAGLMIILSMVIATSTTIAMTARIAGLITVIYMVTAWGLLLFIKSMRQKYLYFQAAYIASFHVTLLVATYL